MMESVAEKMREDLREGIMVQALVKDMEEDNAADRLLQCLREDLAENIVAGRILKNIPGAMAVGIAAITKRVIVAGIIKETIMTETTIIMAEDIIMGITDIAPIITRSPTMAIIPTIMTHTQIIIMDTIQPRRIMA